MKRVHTAARFPLLETAGDCAVHSSLLLANSIPVCASVRTYLPACSLCCRRLFTACAGV
jgi:hypothetical protein